MTARVHDPNRRQHFTFQQDGDDLIVDVLVEPGGDSPPHFHPVQEERWTVLEGEIRFRLGHRRLVLTAADGELVVPSGVKHGVKNTSGKDVRLRARVSPAGELREFLEAFAGASRAGLYTRRGLPRSPRGAFALVRLLRRYRDSAVITGPPRLAQLSLSRRRARV